ncbi:hypothetical protein pdul_cds_989 [Pandoravirus dulcis]|uniref:Ankyrin repeat domain containing protein n=1 Tax=Pandoravirus dulcis TaxID=1349409 RepID=S4VS71_9VIRU|nr:hypothetical protein pdul_cds_989 [Pandoravirus dulcis]AGO83248.1 hypothetical protein pdul_cds_989 [Pandoravirus dulcis]
MEGDRTTTYPQWPDLPLEMRTAILSHVHEARDVGALFFARPGLFARPLIDEVTDRLGAAGVRRAIAAGAPLAAVLYVGERAGMDDHLWKHAARGLLCGAVCGGHLDIVRWLCLVGEVKDADRFCGVPPQDHARFLADVAGRGGSAALSESIVEDNPVAAAACDGAVVAWCQEDRRLDRARALWCYDIALHPMRTEVHMAAALAMAVDADRGDMVRCLLDHWPARSVANAPTRRLPKLFERAVRAGSVSVIEALHQLSRDDCQARCSCPVDAGKVAIQCGRIDVIRWLSAAGCRAAPPPTLCSIEMATKYGHASVVQWACARIRKPLRSTASPKVLIEAAEQGHVEALIEVHRLGAIASTRALAVAAARCGQVRVLKWIAGEEPRGQPLDGWAEPRLGHAAFASPAVVRWMLTRPDARRLLTVGVARYALRMGRRVVPLLLHNAGIAPLDQWNAVATVAACDSPSLPLIARLIDRGALVDVEAVKVGIASGQIDLLAALCLAAQFDTIQAAVDDMAGSGQFHKQAAQWLADRVPGLCLADAYADTKIPASADLRCRCARCRSG